MVMSVSCNWYLYLSTYSRNNGFLISVLEGKLILDLIFLSPTKWKLWNFLGVSVLFCWIVIYYIIPWAHDSNFWMSIEFGLGCEKFELREFVCLTLLSFRFYGLVLLLARMLEKERKEIKKHITGKERKEIAPFHCIFGIHSRLFKLLGPTVKCRHARIFIWAVWRSLLDFDFVFCLTSSALLSWLVEHYWWEVPYPVVRCELPNIGSMSFFVVKSLSIISGWRWCW